MLKLTKQSMRYFCAALLALCISLLSVIGGLKLAKAESPSLREQFERIDLFTELKNSTDKDGKAFDINDYPYDLENGELRVFTVAEFGYSVSSSENYGLYVYVYNPKQLTLDEENANRASVASAFDDSGNGKDFKLFNLQYISKTTGDFDGLFYKYRIVDENNELYALQATRSHERKYEFGQLLIVLDGRSEAFKFGLKCSFSGYAKGCNPDPLVTESTLTGKIDSTLTLTLDVGQTFYRTGYEYDVDNHLQMQLNSIYFSVPNSIISKYGEMVEVSTWYLEAQTAPALIVSDEEGAELVEGSYYDTNGFVYFNSHIAIVGHIEKNVSTIHNNTYHYSYGPKSKIDSFFNIPSGNVYYSSAKNNRDFTETGFPYFFIGTKQTLTRFDGTTYDDVVIPRKEVSDRINLVSKTFKGGERLEFNGRNLKRDLFSSVDPDGDELGTYYKIQRDEMRTLTYLENKRPNWLTALFGARNESVTLDSVKSIEAVTPSAVAENGWEHKLFVDSADKDAFSSYVTNASANSETTYLCRFAVSDYYSADGEAKFYYEDEKMTVPVYLAQQQVYLDLTVLDATFAIGDVYTTISAVATPIDFIASYTGDVGTKPFVGDEIPWWVWLIVGLVILAIALPILISLFPVVGQVLFAILKLLIKGLWWIIKGLGWLIWQVLKLLGKGIYWLFWALSRPIVLLINKIREKRNGE